MIWQTFSMARGAAESFFLDVALGDPAISSSVQVPLTDCSIRAYFRRGWAEATVLEKDLTLYDPLNGVALLQFVKADTVGFSNASQNLIYDVVATKPDGEEVPLCGGVFTILPSSLEV